MDLAWDASNARAAWFDGFTTEAYVVVSGNWPPGHDPDGPEDLGGGHHTQVPVPLAQACR